MFVWSSETTSIDCRCRVVSQMVQDTRKLFRSGRTLPVEWRVGQLNAVLQMLDEQSEALTAALRQDLSKVSLIYNYVIIRLWMCCILVLMSLFCCTNQECKLFDEARQVYCIGSSEHWKCGLFSEGLCTYVHRWTVGQLCCSVMIYRYTCQLCSRPRLLPGRRCVHDDTSPELLQAVSASCASCWASRGRCLVMLLCRSSVTSLQVLCWRSSITVTRCWSAFLQSSWALPAVINTAARLVCHARKADHITPVLKDLHPLQIQGRIQYKLCVLAFKCQHCLAPPYLSDQLQQQQVAWMVPRQHLRSSSLPALIVPPTRR